MLVTVSVYVCQICFFKGKSIPVKATSEQLLHFCPVLLTKVFAQTESRGGVNVFYSKQPGRLKNVCPIFRMSLLSFSYVYACSAPLCSLKERQKETVISNVLFAITYFNWWHIIEHIHS